MSSIHVVLGLAANLDFEVKQMNVKTAFLQCDLTCNNQKVSKSRDKKSMLQIEEELLKLKLNKYSAMNNLGPTRQILGIDDKKDDMKKVLYALAIGSLMYAIICTRHNIAHVVGITSHFLFNLRREHWNTIKMIMRYLYGTSSLSLYFGTRKPILCGYTNAYMIGDIDTHKYTSGYLVTFAGRTVSWQSKL
ncbi:secreted RxLR effector protein 161-like [Nicotiana tomentosiformis]|uniref:secreted RxLR effector protein 161-like n=1 Tax=Nicotiana tomentosiformis TaxID=4098 RepID=UPI00388CC412